jgi:CRISPR system Cascade subunit CasC
MNKNFLNIHVLISHSPSCLNRDDMNMQKSAIFGGKRRVRVSSQSLKRAIRNSDYYVQHLGQPSLRTRELGRLKTKCVLALNERFPEQTVIQAIEYIAGRDGLGDNAELQADAVAPWVVEEIESYCQAIETHQASGLDDDKIKKQIEKDATGFRHALAKGLDVALSGRMVTSGLMTSIDGALAVAHAMTTHSVDADIDWFTAVDDLIMDEGEVGAGHLNTQEFSSGVFYRYASLNLRQLQDNLGGVARNKVLDIGAHLLYLFATVVPSAKQQSFAAHNVADLVLASFSDIPLSLANAFENPVKDQEGYLKPSAKALINYWHKLQTAYGLADDAKLFCLVDDIQVEDQASTLQALQDWVRIAAAARE